MFQSLTPNDPVNPALKLVPSISLALRDQDETKQLFRLEVNGELKSTPKRPKPGLNEGAANAAFGVNGAYWLTVDMTLATISSLIHQGYGFRLGVKIEGTVKSDFTHADFVYLDCDEGATIQDSIKLYGSVACLIYRTVSYTPENQKHRILLRLSERVIDANTVEAILKYLVNQNPVLDKSCTDAARIMYGSLADKPEYYNEDNFLDLAILRADPVFQTILENIQYPPKKELNQDCLRVLPYYYKELVDTQDLNAYCQKIGLKQEFNFKSVTPDKDDILLKWEGSNPFSLTNKSGNSLVVSVFTNNNVGVWDRSNNSGAGFPSFFHSCKHGLSTLATGLSEEEKKTAKDQLASFFVNPYRSYDELYYSPDPNKPEKKKLYDIQQILDKIIYPQMRGMFYRFPIRDKGTITGRVFYSYQKTGWMREANPEALKLKILETFVEVFGDTAPSSISNLLSSNVLLKLPFYLADEKASEPTPDLDHVFFSNGAYNLKDRVLLPLSSDLWYFKVLPYPYKHASNYAAKKLIKSMILSGVSLDDRRIILRQFLLNIQNKGHLTLKMLYLFGLSTTGKSSVAEIFTKALACEVNSADDVANNLDHLGSIFEPVTVLDDVRTLSKVISTLMVMVRKATPKGISYRVCDKYLKAHQKVAPVSIVLTAETMTVGEGSNIQGGFANRIITCEFLNKSKDADSPWREFWANEELIYDLARWAVQQDIKRSPQRINWLHRLAETSSVQQERLKNLLEATNPIFTFMAHIVPTDGWVKGKGLHTDPRFEGLTLDQIVIQYIAITNDPDMKVSNKIAAFKKSFGSKVKDYAPEAERHEVRLKEGAKGKVYKWFGFDIIPGEHHA